MKDVIVEIATQKDTIKFYFDEYSEAQDFVYTALYAAYNEDPTRIVKFCIYVDIDAKMP